MDHRTSLHRILVLATLCAIATALLGAPAASATKVPAPVRRIDAQMQQAERRIRTWQHRVTRWQVQVGVAAARVQRLTFAAGAPSTPFDELGRGLVPWLPKPMTLEEAHHVLQRLLRNHTAQEALQQVSSWQSYLAQLHAARDRAVLAVHQHRAAVQLLRGPVTYESWARMFLDSVGAPECGENLLTVVSWETAESTQALYNPLATTHVMDGATSINDAGVKNYVSLDQGLEATRETLQDDSSTFGYGAIVGSLQACATADVTASAVRDSAWCRECAGGAYLTSLIPVVRADYAEHAARLISTAA